MKVTKDFAPVTIVIETEIEKTYFVNILVTAQRNYEQFREQDMIQRIQHLLSLVAK